MGIVIGVVLVLLLVGLCCWSGGGGETSGKAADWKQYGGPQ